MPCEQWIDEVHGADVSEQLRRFNTSGLSLTEADAVQELLVRLGERTGSEWKPCNCFFTTLLTPTANYIYAETSARDFFGPVESKQFIDAQYHEHFFWTMSAKDGRVLVIDPTGIPETYPEQGGNIVPYFGLADKAPGSHRLVYNEMKDFTWKRE